MKDWKIKEIFVRPGYSHYSIIDTNENEIAQGLTKENASFIVEMLQSFISVAKSGNLKELHNLIEIVRQNFVD